MVLDLSMERASALRGALLEAAENLPAGGLELRLSEPPELVLAAVNNHLRGTLRWRVDEEGGSYRVWLQRAHEVLPADVIDLLLRHHQTLDALLHQALTSAATPLAGTSVEAFAVQLRRHIRVENDILVPRFCAADPLIAEAASTMLHEHDQILEQLAFAEECATEAAQSGSSQLEVFLALLSATLAKHEHREEAALFPYWQRGLEQAPAGAAETLLAEVRAILQGAEERAP